jgi:hypothetical protein
MGEWGKLGVINTFKVIAIPTQIAESVRSTGKAPRYGHPAYTETAKGYGPCRHCLRTFHVGEEQRTLFTYDPFDGIEDVPLPGPIFIHADPCERYADDAGYPEDLRPYPSILNVYAHGPELLGRIFTAPGDAETKICEILANPQVSYIEVRDRNAGCFDFRVERADLTAHNTRS